MVYFRQSNDHLVDSPGNSGTAIVMGRGGRVYPVPEDGVGIERGLEVVGNGGHREGILYSEEFDIRFPFAAAYIHLRLYHRAVREDSFPGVDPILYDFFLSLVEGIVNRPLVPLKSPQLIAPTLT